MSVTEKTAQGDQLVIAGAERIKDRELAERRIAAPLRSRKPQRAADHGLFDLDGRAQTDLFNQ